MNTLAAIALGSNLGDRADHIESGLESMATLPGTILLARSALHETAPVGPAPQGPYLNAAAIVRTSLAPRALLDRLLAIEQARGRRRDPSVRWGPRTLDLDILLIGPIEIDEPGLRIPHPRLAERAFVLAPLAEVLPDAIIPGLNASARDLLARLRV